MKYHLILALLGLLSSTLSHADSLISVSFGDVQLGSSRIPIRLKDFSIQKKKELVPFQVGFIKGGQQWVRDENNLLIPRARLRIFLPIKGKNFFIKYGTKTIIPQKTQKDYRVDLYMNLFNPGDVNIYQEKKLIGVFTAKGNPSGKNVVQEVDHSCSRYMVEIQGLEDDYVSIGCRMERIGKWGREKPRLEITWSATNHRLPDGTLPPYTLFLQDDNPVILELENTQGERRSVTIKADVPDRLHRLKVAMGLGPYGLSAKTGGGRSRNTSIAPAGMFYGKLDLLKSTSLRFFDALIFNETTFNNAGLYFAYELADVFDGRLKFVPLLGFQSLLFKYNNETNFIHDIIFPQGFEMVYKNAFDKKNFSLTYGMFIDPSGTYNYKNIWLRYGKSYFWELNYIEWNKGDNAAKTWGLSVGFPLASFF